MSDTIENDDIIIKHASRLVFKFINNCSTTNKQTSGPCVSATIKYHICDPA